MGKKARLKRSKSHLPDRDDETFRLTLNVEKMREMGIGVLNPWGWVIEDVAQKMELNRDAARVLQAAAKISILNDMATKAGCTQQEAEVLLRRMGMIGEDVADDDTQILSRARALLGGASGG